MRLELQKIIVISILVARKIRQYYVFRNVLISEYKIYRVVKIWNFSAAMEVAV